MLKQTIITEDAPQAIGCYSQAVKADKYVYMSGQIGLSPQTMQLAATVEAQTHQVFKNLKAVAIASGGSLNDIIKLNIYLTDMNDFSVMNEIMSEYFIKPYPARAAIGVNQLPRGALIEIEAVMLLA